MSDDVFPQFDFGLALPAALIVIDMQPIGVQPGIGLVHAMERKSPGFTAHLVDKVRAGVVPAIDRLRKAFRAAGQPVVFMLFGSVAGDGSDIRTFTIRHSSEQRRIETGSSVLASRADPATDVIDDLRPEPEDIVLSKTSMDSFVSTDLDARLRKMGVRSVVVTGVYTDACVESTARTAAELGYRVFVASDGCCTWTPAFHEQSLASMSRFFARIDTSEAIAGLVARHPVA